MVRNQKDNNDEAELAPAFTVTNHAAGLSLNCNANDDLLTADTLGSLIDQLIKLGILNGSVA